MEEWKQRAEWLDVRVGALRNALDAETRANGDTHRRLEHCLRLNKEMSVRAGEAEEKVQVLKRTLRDVVAIFAEDD